MKRAIKYLIFATVLADIYMILAWTYAYQSFSNQLDRKDLMQSLLLDLPIDYVHYILLAFSLFSLIASTKVLVNKLFKSLVIVILVLYLLLGVWTLL